MDQPGNKLNPQELYRLPWSLTDNAISWLEVTTACNLACQGCYRDTRSPDGHKSLAQIADDLAVFKRTRNSDCISIAGGDPLVHPQIVEIVRMIHEGGWKPIVNTNGLALTPQLLGELKRAGVYGFTFHIDTSQRRGDAKRTTTEAGYNMLRQRFAQMLAREGGIACSFNQTVTTDTLDEVPDVMRWAQRHPDIVHSVVFILYREPKLFENEYDYYANGQKIPVEEDYKRPDAWGGERPLRADDVVAKLREVDPDFAPCAYLGGTANPQSTKWLLATRVANPNRGFGYYSPRVMEVLQQSHHLFTGNWLAYSPPSTLSKGRASLAAFSLFDRKMRSSAWRFLRNGLRRPKELLQRAHSQSFLIIQPIDLTRDGRADMCDGCPDMTVHEGKLYWSCRLEEIKQHGCFVTAVPRRRENSVGAAEELAAATRTSASDAASCEPPPPAAC
jgi:pyruvate-formate lyase-activating enzyme